MEIEISVKNYKGIEVQKHKATVSELEIAQKIEQDLQSLSTLENVEGVSLQNGLIAVMDFVGRMDGKEFEGGKGQDYSLEIGSGTFIPGFEDQMVGMKIGEERVLKLKFPENYQATQLAGKDCEFTVNLKQIQKRVSPSLTNETVEKMEIEGVKNVEEYKELVSAALLAEKERYFNNQAIDAIYQKLFDENPFEIPAEMVNVSVEKEVERAKAQAKAYQIPFEIFLKYQGIDTEEEFKKLIFEGVERLMRRDLVLNAIAKAEKIEVSEEEFENYYKMFAENQKMDIEKVKEQFPKEMLASKILLFKAEDFVVSNAKITIIE